MPAILWAVAGAVGMVLLGDLRDQAFAAVCILLLWAAGVLALPRPSTGPRHVFLVAMLVRVVLLASPATLSDDIYRYIWEGTLTAHGGNPYLHAPADPALLAWVDNTHRAMVNHPQVPSVYPPLAMGLFAVLAAVWDDPLVFKLVSGLADAGTALVLARILQFRGLRIDGAWLYALLPLAAVESAGSGHLDAIAVLCLALAIEAWDRRRTGVLWAGLGALLKLMPALILVPLMRRFRRTAPEAGLVALLGIAALLPFLDAGPRLFEGLGTYTAHWSFNGSVYPLAAALFGESARPLLMGVGVATVAWASWNRSDPAEVAWIVGTAFILLSPTVHPWYVAWAWVPALICGIRAHTLLAALVPLSYVVLATVDPNTGQWSEDTWPRVVIYGAFLARLAHDGWRRWTNAGPYTMLALRP